MTVAELRKHLEGMDGDRIVFIATYNMEDVVEVAHLDVGEWKGKTHLVIGEDGITPCTHETRLI